MQIVLNAVLKVVEQPPDEQLVRGKAVVFGAAVAEISSLFETLQQHH